MYGIVSLFIYLLQYFEGCGVVEGVLAPQHAATLIRQAFVQHWRRREVLKAKSL